ncbi:MAG: hypothetical protein AAF677_16460 [Pseudomonadota bacterium]
MNQIVLQRAIRAALVFVAAVVLASQVYGLVGGGSDSRAAVMPQHAALAWPVAPGTGDAEPGAAGIDAGLGALGLGALGLGAVMFDGAGRIETWAGATAPAAAGTRVADAAAVD